MSRYLMHRVCELYNIDCSFDPKPIDGDWNGAGGHVNFSNNDSRKEGTGWDAIQVRGRSGGCSGCSEVGGAPSLLCLTGHKFLLGTSGQ